MVPFHLTMDDPKLSILFLGTQMTLGGAQRGLLDQARWFADEGHHVCVVFFYDKDGLQQDWQASVPFPIYNLQAYGFAANRLAQAGMLLRGLYRMWDIMRSERFDVVETFTHDSNILGIPVAWLARIPVRIATHRGKIEDFARWRQKLHNFIINRKIASTLVVVSEQTKKQAIQEGVDPGQIKVIQNAVVPLDVKSVDRKTARAALGVSDNEIFVFSVGRLTYQKAQEYLVKAMSSVIAQAPQVKTGIAGEGPFEAALKDQIRKQNLNAHVKLLGTLPDISPWLAAADIFVLPSRWEGLSRSLMEAMAAGVPVVATQVDGTRDLITDGVNGLLVPPEDAEALANSILQFVTDPAMRTQLARAGRDHVLRAHSNADMCRQYLALMFHFLRNV